MTTPKQLKNLKEHFSNYNINGVLWGSAGNMGFIIGPGNFSSKQVNMAPGCYNGFNICIAMSSIKSPTKRLKKSLEYHLLYACRSFGKNVDRKLFNGINTKQIIEESIPELNAFVERIGEQFKSIEGEMLKKRSMRRIQELKKSFKDNVHIFSKRYKLNKEEVLDLMEDCMKEISVETVMKG